jgi:DNA polymerase I
MAYSFQHDPEVDWTIIRTPEALEEASREMADQRYASWDVETTGLDIWGRSRVIGHAAAWRRSNGRIRSIYAPMRHDTHLGVFDVVRQLEPDQVIAAFKPLLEGPALKMGHNLNFDVGISYHDGIEVAGPVHDTLIGAKLIDENQQSYRLEKVLERANILHQRGWKDMIKPDLASQAKHLRMKLSDFRQQHGYEFVTVDRLGLYANQDAVYELRLGEYQLPFVNQWPDIWQMEMRLFWVCLAMGRVGVPIKAKVLQDLAAEQQAVIDDLAPKIWQLAGEEFEISKDAQVRRILFHKLGYESQGKTKSEVDRIDDDVLWSLERFQNSEIAKLLRQYNAAAKVVSTYTTNIVELAVNGVLHGEVDQAGAKTGRVSMRRPNLPNIPIRTELGRRVREAFVTRPGMVRYCCDYSQIELRILAHLSQDPLLLKVYREGLDAHRTTALEAFGTADKVAGVDMRRVAKILNFGVSFGMTEHGLMGNINKDLPDELPPIDESRAKGFLDSFYAKYRGIDAYRQALWYQARLNSGLFWNVFGRPRRVPRINHADDWVWRRAERQATSSMVQGSAADLVKFSMVAVHDYLKAQNDCEAYMVLMVHDDLQFDMAPSGSAKVIREIKRIMEQTCQHKLSVPIKADVEYFTDHWGNKKSMEL